MLTNDIKRNIDSLRDTLVGKIPDPKAQVEQITIALIYKFMNDMDDVNVDLGGQASFFSGEYAKYSWRNILSPQNSGQERVNLYMEGLEKMNENPNLPQLFRDIFRGAYLPYRDPETLNLFLKGINLFSYDHSENLGDAFEYLLLVLGSQGDAGQFRTPRHIIDMMVEIVDPQKNQTVLDPACGTAGFLISAYRHILENNKNAVPGDKLTHDERDRLMNNYTGYDISPDMVRLSRVNMYLHNFPNPKIHEYDTLTLEDRWNDTFDIIMANPPFMTPKGGIRPHKRFSVTANRSEVLFVDYIAEHLNPNGRAAIIVPEGIVFQAANAYKALRKYIVDSNYLYAVISLPSGVFNPYAGVKTSILLFDKALAKKADRILFVKIENDGFDLGAQRRAIQGSELPWVTDVVKRYQLALAKGGDLALNDAEKHKALLVNKTLLADNEYILTGDRYRVNENREQKWPTVPLKDVVEILNGRAYKQEELLDEGKTPVLRVGNFFSNKDWFYSDLELEDDKYCERGDLLYAWSASFGPKIWDGPKAIYHYHIWKIITSDQIDKMYLYYLLKSDTGKIKEQGHGSSMIHITKEFMENRMIPLPPLSVQEEIVAEVEGYQRVIDGARLVVENYRPIVKVDTEWPMVKLSQADIEIIDGDRGENYPKKEEFSQQGFCLFLNTSNVREGYFNFNSLQFISQNKDLQLRKGKLNRYDVVMTTRGTVGNIALFDDTIPYENVRINSGMLILRPNIDTYLPSFICTIFNSEWIQSQIRKALSGSAQPQLPIRTLIEFTIPTPPKSVQSRIVAQIERERSIINANKELISIMQTKIDDVMEKVCGE